MATRKPKPGFDVTPAGPSDTGWVYRSDATTTPPPPPTPPPPVASREAGALEIVGRYMTYGAVAGFVPVPIVDLAAIGSVQYFLVRELAEHYVIDFDGERARGFIAALAGSVLPTSVGHALAANIAYRLPGIGWLAGLVTVPALASATTYATGKVFIQHFESGGTFLDFDPATVREFFERMLAKAR